MNRLAAQSARPRRKGDTGREREQLGAGRHRLRPLPSHPPRLSLTGYRVLETTQVAKQSGTLQTKAQRLPCSPHPHPARPGSVCPPHASSLPGCPALGPQLSFLYLKHAHRCQSTEPRAPWLAQSSRPRGQGLSMTCRLPRHPAQRPSAHAPSERTGQFPKGYVMCEPRLGQLMGRGRTFLTF